MDDFLVLWLWILPISFGAVCTLVLQFCSRRLHASFTRSSKTEWPRVKPYVMDQSAEEKTCCQRGTSQCVDTTAYIFLSSTGKAHKSANCCGKNPKKVLVCAKCFKWSTAHCHGGKKTVCATWFFWTCFSRCRPHIKVNYTKGNWYESTIIWSVWLCNQLHHQTIQWSIPKGNIFISLCHLGPVFPTILYILGHQLTHQIWNNTQENGMTKFIPWLLWGSVFPNVWFDWDIRSSIKY